MSPIPLYIEYEDEDVIMAHYKRRRRYIQVQFELVEQKDNKRPKNGIYEVTRPTSSRRKNTKLNFTKKDERYDSDKPLEIFKQAGQEFIEAEKVYAGK